jgi:hypothetical protein
MFMAVMAMVLPWIIDKGFQSFVKYTKLWTSLQKCVSPSIIGLGRSCRSCLRVYFQIFPFSSTFCVLTWFCTGGLGYKSRFLIVNKIPFPSVTETGVTLL